MNPDLAMILWNEEYARSGLGSMGFWDTRSTGQKETCRALVKRLLQARDEEAR